jgi:type I restriction enzyme S subunit
MNIVKLDDVANFVNGGAWNQSEYTEKGIPVVRVSDIHHATVDLSQCKYLPHSAIEKYAKNRLEAGDLVICTVGSHATQPNSVVGRPGIIPAHCRGTLLNQNAVCIRPKNNQINKLWLGYLARSQKMKDHIIAHARGSASQVRVAISALKDFEFEIPSLIEQETVSKILNNYDNLIENNNRRIAILEDMAQSLYREWFVNFRYPGHADAVDKDGNQKLIDSPLGQIPEGWEVKPISASYKTSSGGTPSRSQSDYYGDDHWWVKTKELKDGFVVAVDERISDLGLKKSSAKLFPKHSVLLAMYGATIGRLGILSEVASSNQACCALLPLNDSMSNWFIYLLLLNDRKKLISLGQGAAQQNISQSVIQGFKILVPTDYLLNMFNIAVEPMFSSIENLSRRNMNLKQQRDMLLPKLISGQIELKE